MNIDKKRIYILSFSLFVIISFTLFLPIDYIRIGLSVVLFIYAICICLLIKKRSILSIYKKQVLFIVLVSAILYLTIYYITGLRFDFQQGLYSLSFNNFFKYILPTIIIVVSFELIRSVLLDQNIKIISGLSFIIAVLIDFLLVYNKITSFNIFMDIVGLSLIPSIIFNLMYHNFSKNYGYLPNIGFRLITSLYIYILPILPGLPDSLFALYKIFFPLFLLWFVKILYQPKQKMAKEQRITKIGTIIFGTTVLAMTLLVALISNQFRFGVIVIATNSMNEEIYSGDVVVFEKVDSNDVIEVGKIVVFEKEGSLIVHRVVDVEYIDGIVRYYTKGDANDQNDEGFITINDIVGYVDFKIPYIGYPSLWIRQYFD